MSKVSVIIPAFNHEQFVAEAIQSVLDQTYQDFEIVITDDGSTDSTVDVIKTFVDERIKLFCFQQNQGASKAANNCIAHSSGEYIAMLSSDDAFYPDKLEKQVEFLENHTEVGAVFSQAEIINEQGSLLEKQDHFYQTAFLHENRSRFEWLHYFFFNGNCLCHPSALIRRQCYEHMGQYEEYYAQLPDFDFWIRLCSHYDIYIIPEKLIKFRVRSNEANASGNRPETIVRTRTELFNILRGYKKRELLTSFSLIFPAEDIVGSEASLYDLAKVALKRAENSVDQSYASIYRCFAIDVLFEHCSSPQQNSRFNQHFQLLPKDFIELAGRIDTFGYFTLQEIQMGLEKAKSEVEEGRIALEEGQTALEEAKSEIEESRIALEKAESEIKENRTALEKAKSEMQEVQSNLRQKELEIQTIKNSRIWKIKQKWISLKHFLTLKRLI